MTQTGKTAILKIKGPGQAALLDISSGTGHGLTGLSDSDAATPISWAEGDTMKRIAATQDDKSIPFTVNHDEDTEPHLLGNGGQMFEYEYGPSGGASGKPKWTGNAFLDAYNHENPPDGRATFSGTLMIDTRTVGTF